MTEGAPPSNWYSWKTWSSTARFWVPIGLVIALIGFRMALSDFTDIPWDVQHFATLEQNDDRNDAAIWCIAERVDDLVGAEKKQGQRVRSPASDCPRAKGPAAP
jgi:hypothetical protein